jgi:hypothetical protein
MANTYLVRTPSSAGNRKTFTISTWLKRSKLSYSYAYVITAGEYNQDQMGQLKFDDNDRLNFSGYNSGGSQEFRILTTRRFRDVSGWYHIVVSVDTTQATASNRVKIYINNEQVTAFEEASYPSQNYDSAFNLNGIQSNIGIRAGTATYFEGCMSHFHLVDGSALAPTVFGSTDATTGEWKINTSPSYTVGTNGFFILKDTNSGTDQSANSNNYTVGSGTLTKTEDCPSNVFATLNPLVRNKSYNDGTLTNGNLGFAPNGRAVTCSTLGVTSGKYYAEFKATDAGGLYLGAGLMKGITSQGQTNPIWYDNTTGYAIAIADNGTLQAGSSTSASYGPTFADNDIIGIALDMDNKEMYIHKNGTYMNSGDPTSGANKTGGVTGALSYNPFDDGEEVFFMVADISAGGVGECQCNFGNGYFGTTAISSAGTNASNIGIFEYDVPSGYTALCTKGLNE